MKPVARTLCCESCSRPREDVEGFILILRTGIRPALCYDCIDQMKAMADEARAPMAEAAE